MIQSKAATQVHPAGDLHFEVHRTALAEAGADAALGAAWALLWLLFVLALAPPAPALGQEPSALGPGPALAPAVEWLPFPAALPPPPAPAWQLGAGAGAQPDPGPSARGVAPPDPGGAG